MEMGTGCGKLKRKRELAGGWKLKRALGHKLAALGELLP